MTLVKNFFPKRSVFTKIHLMCALVYMISLGSCHVCNIVELVVSGKSAKENWWCRSQCTLHACTRTHTHTHTHTHTEYIILVVFAVAISRTRGAENSLCAPYNVDVY